MLVLGSIHWPENGWLVSMVVLARGWRQRLTSCETLGRPTSGIAAIVNVRPTSGKGTPDQFSLSPRKLAAVVLSDSLHHSLSTTWRPK